MTLRSSNRFRQLSERRHPAAEAQHQMQCRLLLDTVGRHDAAVFQLLACEEQPLEPNWHAELTLDLRFHDFRRVRRAHVEGCTRAGQRPHEDLHVSSYRY